MTITLSHAAQLLLVGMAKILEDNGHTELASEILKNIYPAELEKIYIDNGIKKAENLFEELIIDNVQYNY